jgi:Domain of unknown function (DUF4956)
MPASVPFLLDLIAISILAFGLYFPRHHRKDLVVAFFGVNIGVLAVAEAFTSTAVTAGLGLGLFGVLSIIRLRSTELDQQEVAYYFVALALGVLGGVPVTPEWLSPALMAALLLALAVADHPALLAGYRTQNITLDRAYTDEHDLRLRLEEMLNADVRRVTIRRTDLVEDTTVVEVRYRLRGVTAERGAPARVRA